MFNCKQVQMHIPARKQDTHFHTNARRPIGIRERVYLYVNAYRVCKSMMLFMHFEYIPFMRI